MKKFFTILGGMGTLATESYVRLLNKKTETHKDQDYLDYIVVNHATIPDRTAWILDHHNPDFNKELIEDIEQQSLLQPAFFALICNTAHCAFDKLQVATDIPILNMPEETVKAIKQVQPSAKRVVILATPGTIQSGIYDQYITNDGYEEIKPNAEILKLTEELIYDDIKKKGQSDNHKFHQLIEKMSNEQGADIVILGCTELSYAQERNYFLHYDRSARLAVQTVTVDLYTPYRRLIHELFPHAIIIADHFHVVAQAYRALNRIRIQAMNYAGKGTHQWRALKHFWKLILTPASELKYDNYWRRANFGYAQLTDVEVIHRLLSFDEDLQQANRYYQDLIFTVSQRSRSRLNQLLTTKLTVLPQPLQKVQRTLRQHKKEILHSFKYEGYTNGPVEGTNNKIKVIKRVAYGFRNFANFRIKILLSLPNTYIAINWKNKQAARAKVQARAA